MREKQNESTLKMSYEELIEENKKIEIALNFLCYETLTNLNSIQAPVATNFRLENEMFFLTFDTDEKHSMYFFPDRTDDGELFIGVSQDEDYLINEDITTPRNEFFEIMNFYRNVTATLGNAEYLKEVSDILLRYYQESKDLTHKSIEYNEMMINLLSHKINQQTDKFKIFNKFDEQPAEDKAE